MKTITQIWGTFRFDKAQLLYYIMKGFMMDIANIITKDIFKIVISQLIIWGTTRPLSFPSLIAGLCTMQGVYLIIQGRN